MPKALTFADLMALLRRSSSFTSVELEAYWDDTGQAVFLVCLAPNLRQEFIEDVKQLLKKRVHAHADNEVEAVMVSLLLGRQVTHGMPFTVEFGPEYRFDIDCPEAPTHASIIITMKTGIGARTKKKIRPRAMAKPTRTKTKNSYRPKGSSSSSILGSNSSNSNRANAIRLEDERIRSKNRRDIARAEKLDSGIDVRVGKLGYTKKVFDAKSEREVWVASSPEADRVLREMDRTWGKTIHTGADLARHLNMRRSPMLRTLGGKRFTRSMMTGLLRHLERFRLTKVLRRQARTTG